MLDDFITYMYHLMGTNPIPWLGWGIYASGLVCLLSYWVKEALKGEDHLGTGLVMTLTWPLWVGVFYIFFWAYTEQGK